MNVRQGLYADPMIYDILHSPGTALEVTAFERVEALFAKGPLKHDRLWFEPACGTGRYLRVAARRGRRIAGFDWDLGQIEYARGRIKGGRGSDTPPQFYQADMRNFLVDSTAAGYQRHTADFAFNPVNSIRLLESDQEMLDHLDQMAEILRPGALYMVGISLTNYNWLFPEEDVWEGTRGRCKVSQLINFLPPKPGTERDRIETAISHLTVSRPRGEDHFDDSYGLRTYDKDQWLELVGRSPLKHAGSFDGWGVALGQRVLPYQLEVLVG